jgi:prepilin-type N-terminal cleavage/methylation domain-containing protein
VRLLRGSDNLRGRGGGPECEAGKLARSIRPVSWGNGMLKRIGLTLGFTLIEMAIVLVVIGLILSGGLMAVGPALQSSKVSETVNRMDRIEQALIVHVIRFGCLPCPATAATASTDAAAGQAVAGAAYATGCAAAACTNALQGIAPWVNLGLSEADITDGFGYRIAYAIRGEAATGLQLADSMVRTPPAGYPAGNLVVNNTAAVPVQITAAAAYVLISHGPDKSLGFATATGTQTIDPNGSANQTANSDGTPFVQDSLIGISGATHFDDIVRWRTAPIIIQLCGSNACGNPA